MDLGLQQLLKMLKIGMCDIYFEHVYGGCAWKGVGVGQVASIRPSWLAQLKVGKEGREGDRPSSFFFAKH